MTKPSGQLKFYLFFFFLSVLGAGMMGEVFIEGLLRAPYLLQTLPDQMLWKFRNYYSSFDRVILNNHLDMVRYDQEVFYTLKPGLFHFKNREYNVSVSVNSLGVRGSEAALLNPEIVVLGDSLSMGWGVEQDQSYPEVLSKITGKRVLNIAVSSYGTAREVLLFQRWARGKDLSHVQTLIIQYCSNDYLENASFYTHGQHLPIRSEEFFNENSHYMMKTSKYFPFKHLAWFLLPTQFLASFYPSPQGEAFEPKSYNHLPSVPFLFLNAFNEIFKDGKFKPKIFIMNLEGWMQNKPEFVHGVAAELIKDRGLKNHRKWSAHLETVQLLDVSKFLNRPEYYYTLDDHPTPLGQRAIADQIGRNLGL